MEKEVLREIQILREMQGKIVTNFLDVLILAHLRKGPKIGYDLLIFVQKKFRILMSPGTVYSTIHSLERDGLIQGYFTNRKRRSRVYTLTDKGEKTIQTILKVDTAICIFVDSILRGLSE